ncbi:MAG: FmdB family zinc ribbon protein [Dehalococcoidia bacterium]
MPIYEFHCEACDQTVEVFTRTVASATASTCPRCGSADLRRLVSRFAVHRSGDVYGSGDEERYLDGLDGMDAGEEGDDFDDMGF